MYPLNTEIYVKIVKYRFHLLELMEQGNELIKLGLRECKWEKKCLLQPLFERDYNFIPCCIGFATQLVLLVLIKTVTRATEEKAVLDNS